MPISPPPTPPTGQVRPQLVRGESDFRSHGGCSPRARRGRRGAWPPFGAQGPWVEGLADVVDGAGRVSAGGVFGSRAHRSQEEDGNVSGPGEAFDMSAGLMAVRLWHLRVHDDDGEVVVVEQGFEGFPAGGEPDQLLPERRQNCGHRQQAVRLIIDDEDLVHALRPRRQHNRCGPPDGVQLAFEEIAAALRRSTLSRCLLEGCSEAFDFQLESVVTPDLGRAERREGGRAAIRGAWPAQQLHGSDRPPCRPPQCRPKEPAASRGEAGRTVERHGPLPARGGKSSDCQRTLFSLSRALARPLAHSWLTRARSVALG